MPISTQPVSSGDFTEVDWANDVRADLLLLTTSIDDLGNLSPVIETNAATTQQDDLAITTTTGTLVFTGGSDFDLTGIVAPADEGKVLIVIVRGAGTVTFKDESVSSTAANRFDLGGSDVSVQTDQAAILVYENSRWRAAAKPGGGGSLASSLRRISLGA